MTFDEQVAELDKVTWEILQRYGRNRLTTRLDAVTGWAEGQLRDRTRWLLRYVQPVAPSEVYLGFPTMAAASEWLVAHRQPDWMFCMIVEIGEPS